MTTEERDVEKYDHEQTLDDIRHNLDSAVEEYAKEFGVMEMLNAIDQSIVRVQNLAAAGKVKK